MRTSRLLPDFQRIAGRRAAAVNDWKVFNIPRKLVGWLASQIGAMQREARYRRSCRDLQALDDHLLRDIGLHRSEINSVVRHGRLSRSVIRGYRDD